MLGIWVPSLPSVGHATGAGTRSSWMPLLEYSGDAVKTTCAAERRSIRRARRRQANRRAAAPPGSAPALSRSRWSPPTLVPCALDHGRPLIEQRLRRIVVLAFRPQVGDGIRGIGQREDPAAR